MSLFNFIRGLNGQKTAANSKTPYTGSISIFLAGKKVAQIKSNVVYANSRKEGLRKLEKAVSGDIAYQVKIKKTR